MRVWLVEIFGEQLATGAMIVTVTLAIIIAFAVLFALYKRFSRNSIAGNPRSRNARLAVMDAAAIDSRRKLVLVRRDDVEHLVMIGGPTDIVVEQNIRRQRIAQPQGVAPRQTAVAQHTASVQRPPPGRPQQPAGRPPARVPQPPAPSPTPPVAPTTSNKPQPTAHAQPAANPELTNRIATAAAPVAAVAAAVSGAAGSPATQPRQQSKPVMGAQIGSKEPVSPAIERPLSAQANSIYPEETNKESAKTLTEPVKNQLSDFEDNLAMELGETLVDDKSITPQSNLSKELDALLSEMTSDSPEKPS